MRKGRHRRHQDARSLKRALPVEDRRPAEPCDECQRTPHAEWCLAETEDLPQPE